MTTTITTTTTAMTTTTEQQHQHNHYHHNEQQHQQENNTYKSITDVHPQYMIQLLESYLLDDLHIELLPSVRFQQLDTLQDLVGMF